MWYYIYKGVLHLQPHIIKGDPYPGKIYVSPRHNYPHAFYEEGSKRAIDEGWVCVEIYEQDALTDTYWYYFKNGSYSPSRWLNLDGKWYYTNTNGVMSGWQKIDGMYYYYFDPQEYYMWTSGNVERDGVMYTIGKDGISRVASELGYSGDVAENGGDTGWSEENEKSCFLRDGQKIHSEWLQDGDKWYYIGSDGYLCKGVTEVDGTVYRFDSDGHMETDCTGYYGKQKYQFGADGKGVPLEMTAEEKIRHSDVAAWMEATYAIYSMDAQAAQLMGASYDVKELLAADWGITDRENGLAMIDLLTANAGGETDRDAKAWDYSRAMLLCDTLRQAEYISLEEQAERQLAIVPSIQSSFSSWDDFNTHYLNGFAGWAYAAGRGDAVSRRQNWYEYMQLQSDNPFLIDWNLSLKKDW